MYSILYNDAGLVGVTNTEVQAIAGVSYITVEGNVPDLNTFTWDKETLTFVRHSTFLTKKEFLERFTLQERAAIRNSQDAVVNDLMFLLDAATYIDLSDVSLIQGVGYLAMVNLITESRIQQILGSN